ncbi:hypothetical protein EDD37DRAFT_478166 [Exophiala viscosa]|uniref:uncharacterized protein n=1 Tax=Exophiala viscosa TaxID=2486360 RepID=UPI0021934BA7|nr:hypothetical protein EDD37DRAFT_478166 [Exophiala viscosa]
MRFAIVAISTLLAGIVSAQSSPSIPTCADTCITDALPASCNLAPACICSTPSFISGISCCIYKSCDTADQQAALAYAHSICDPVGYSSVLPATAGCSANSTSSATAASSNGTASATGAIASASASASSVISSLTSSLSAAASTASTSATAASGSATSTASAAGSSASSSAIAANLVGAKSLGIGAVAAAFLGLAALL